MSTVDAPVRVLDAVFPKAGAAHPPGPEAAFARALLALGGARRPEHLIERAPAVLVRWLAFERATLLRVEHTTCTTLSAASSTGRAPVPQGERALTDLELEVVRRRGPALVPGCSVVAPVLAETSVIGLLHAVPAGTGSAQDRDLLHAFAVGFGHLFERATLEVRLAASADRARAFATTIAAGLAPSQDAVLRLGPPDRASVARVPLTAVSRAENGAQLLLTARQLEVLELMAAGRTNAEIADALTVSEGTVKSHVKLILRRLKAANRAEAVSRYMRLAGARAA